MLWTGYDLLRTLDNLVSAVRNPLTMAGDTCVKTPRGLVSTNLETAVYALQNLVARVHVLVEVGEKRTTAVALSKKTTTRKTHFQDFFILG